MTDIEKKMLEEILKNQFVFAHQLLIFNESLARVLEPLGDNSKMKKKHKCKLLEDTVKRTRELLKSIKEQDDEVCNICKDGYSGR